MCEDVCEFVCVCVSCLCVCKIECLCGLYECVRGCLKVYTCVCVSVCVSSEGLSGSCEGFRSMSIQRNGWCNYGVTLYAKPPNHYTTIPEHHPIGQNL